MLQHIFGVFLPKTCQKLRYRRGSDGIRTKADNINVVKHMKIEMVKRDDCYDDYRCMDVKVILGVRARLCSATLLENGASKEGLQLSEEPRQQPRRQMSDE